MHFHSFTYEYGQLTIRFSSDSPSEALKHVSDLLGKFPPLPEAALEHLTTATPESAVTVTPAEEAPKTRRTRSPAVEVPAAEVAEAPRRRTRKTEDKPADISDYDLSKAASEAAEKHGIDTVLGVLQDFKVKRVNELAQADRPVFLDQLVNGLGNS